MSPRTLIWRALTFHWRSHVGTVGGALLGSAVLVGALLVGDSVRGSLREVAIQRLGRVEWVLDAQDRFVQSNLGHRLGAALGVPAASLLRLPGTITRADGSARANQVHVLGVDDPFWALAPERPAKAGPSEDELWVNAELAAQLGVREGDSVLIRLPKPSRLSPEAPLAPTEDTSVVVRAKVGAIVPDRAFGRFHLQATQLPPLNAYMSLAVLQHRLQSPDRANLVLLGKSADIQVDQGQAQEALRRVWQLPDAELELRPTPSGAGLELRSPRVFLDLPIGLGSLQAFPGAQGVLTYFVNEMRLGDQATPYSMVTAAGPPFVPSDLTDDEMIINAWLAEDLHAKPGDSLTVRYYVVGLARQLEEKSHQFRVRAIVPLEGAAADRSLMPDFPGLAEADNCRDWDAGFPIQSDRIRPKDEQYWDDHRGTPKAFVNLEVGRRLWGNRYGDLTAVRLDRVSDTNEVAAALLRRLDPGALGLVWVDVGARAAAASAQSLDFGPLFLGFSMFLIAAALLLMGLMFQLGIERRSGEVGTLLALGWSPAQVRVLLLGEGLGLAIAGTAVGVVLGAGYARLMIHGLSTVWRDAVGSAGLGFHMSVSSVVAGGGASLLMAVVIMWLALREQARRPARELLAEGQEERRSRMDGGVARWQPTLAWSAAITSLGLAAWGILWPPANSAGLFFGSGSLFLISGLSWVAIGLAKWLDRDRALQSGAAGGESAATIRLHSLALRNAGRRRRRSVTTVALLASGAFVVASLGVFRLDSAKDAFRRTSGTGGFALIGASTLPVVHDLNQSSGREAFGLSSADLGGVQVVPLRVREGDDASCLNLNRAQRPRLLGVRPEALDERGAFTFTRVMKGVEAGRPWMLLKRPGAKAATDSSPIPAIGDQASIQWALGKKVGDILTFEDERGQRFNLQLVASVANSVLQGNLLIDEAAFVQKFTSVPGYRMFLIDAPSNRVAGVQSLLTRALEDVGLELVPANRRLAAFNAVQNTYLTTFQLLGGLGLILGSAGLGAVVLRNVLERRSELAVLLALGFAPRRVRWMVTLEHTLLLLLGLVIAVAAAALAVVPALAAPGEGPPVGSLSLTLAGVLAHGLFWVWTAVRLACRGPLTEALRYE